MMKINNKLQKFDGIQSLYWILSLSFIFIIFVVNIAIPSKFTIDNLYIFPLFLGIFLLSSQKAATFLTLTCIILIAVRVIISSLDLVDLPIYLSAVFNIITLIFTATLITFYKKSLTEIKWSEEKAKVALDGAPNGIIMTDYSGEIIYANNEVKKLFGYGKEEIIGLNVDSLVPKRIRSSHSKFRNSYLENPTNRPMGEGRNLFGVHKDGTEVPVEVGLRPINFNKGIYVLVSIIDISERKKQEDEKEQFINQLTRSNQELDDFAYIASHDLKEPLRGIYNNSTFLIEDYESILDSSGKNKLNRLLFLCQKMERLIDELLHFSRLGKQKLAIQNVSLNEVVSEVKELFIHASNDKNISINIIDVLPTLVCDRVRITEAIRNLISNGLKYNNSSQKVITIGLHNITKKQNKNLYTFYVKDNGIGINKEFKTEIFRIFKRLNIEDDEKQGSGVGLTFVKKIIERHGGKIWWEPANPAGTIFYFSILEGEVNYVTS